MVKKSDKKAEATAKKLMSQGYQRDEVRTILPAHNSLLIAFSISSFTICGLKPSLSKAIIRVCL